MTRVANAQKGLSVFFSNVDASGLAVEELGVSAAELRRSCRRITDGRPQFQVSSPKL